MPEINESDPRKHKKFVTIIEADNMAIVYKGQGFYQRISSDDLNGFIMALSMMKKNFEVILVSSDDSRAVTQWVWQHIDYPLVEFMDFAKLAELDIEIPIYQINGEIVGITN